MPAHLPIGTNVQTNFAWKHDRMLLLLHALVLSRQYDQYRWPSRTTQGLGFVVDPLEQNNSAGANITGLFSCVTEVFT